MNESLLSSVDIMMLTGAVAASFVLGGAFRLGRAVVRERDAVELTEYDIRELSDRYEHQQRNVSQLTQELSDMRQALMQQAMAMGPVHAAFNAPAHAAPAAVAPAPVVTVQPAPVQAAPVAQAPVQAAPVQAAPAPVAAAAQAPVQASPVPAARQGALKPAAAKPAPVAREPQASATQATPMALARAGASIEVLMQRCGLSRAEADLVVSVHGRSAAA